MRYLTNNTEGRWGVGEMGRWGEVYSRIDEPHLHKQNVVGTFHGMSYSGGSGALKW
ncbi:hypothetical protein [Okeania sp. SIO2B3]|uniref:hypothetical protein n=1 Tax=Okeania sp. SIO2B3 TaxID=2607784 RepID=UPI0013C1A035|nr:hypothetical protein [Okeania sp. SIO2B3]NET40422.1 hypothetical protein [Okeania sp. SIO2B3]